MYMMEMVPLRKKKTINMLGAIADSAVIVVIAVYYYYIKFGESMFHLYLVHSSITLVILFKIPESPHFLYSKKKWKELHD
jgi:hypothetical protein